MDKIVVSNKTKGNNETRKIFIGYLDDISGNVTPLCIILPQMSGWMKYFENGGKNMPFKIEDDEIYIKYNSIWNKIKDSLGGLKFYSEPIYDDSCIKTKVKILSDKNSNTTILDKVREPIMSEQIESKGVEDLSKKADNSDDAGELVKKIAKIIKNNKNNILMLAYHQLIFRKFKENNKFVSAVTN